MRSAWTRCVGAIQNSSERLTDDDVNVILDDVYVPAHMLRNANLRNWFSETDSWWFDNIRSNLDRLGSPFKFALGADLAMSVGDYVHSFTEETRELRQPLSNVYRRLWMSCMNPINNGQITLPQQNGSDSLPNRVRNLYFSGYRFWHWRRGRFAYCFCLARRMDPRRNEFWADLNRSRSGKLGSRSKQKSHY